MVSMPAATRPHEQVLEMGGQRWFLATREQAAEMGLKRSWDVDWIAEQGVDRSKPFTLDLDTFHGGYGYSSASIPGVYNEADGWDLAAPGKARTWPVLSSFESFVTVSDYRGWIIEHGGYVYVMRGRYVAKYRLDDAPGSTPAILSMHNVGSGMAVAGQPAIFAGDLYVPIVQVSDDTLQRFHRLSTVAAEITEVQTIVISGTPTAGTYTVTYNDGVDTSTTSALAYNASGATLQAALRLLPGLQKVTVVTTGSTPNFTHTITMTAAPSALASASPPQFTSTDSTTGGTHAITHATTVAGTTDQWDRGPALILARAFETWFDRLARASSNNVSTATADPMTAGNWGADYPVGDAGHPITQMAVLGDDLLCAKADGLWSFDESAHARHEVSDLEHVIDAQNGIGMHPAQGALFMPHRAGFLRWRPGANAFVGAEQEGYLEGDLDRGWGRVMAIAPFGKSIYYTVNDVINGVGALASLRPGQRAIGFTPHMSHIFDGPVEHAATLSLDVQPALPASDGVGSDDAAVGSIAWSNPTNVNADDDTYATAAVGTSHYLKVLLPADTRVPAGATVLGVVVNIQRKVATHTLTYSYTGSEQTLVVPAGVTTMHVTLDGASASGRGGEVSGDLATTPAETLRLFVGSTAGYNGGGSANGAGASDIRQGGSALANRVAVAGGGGGAGGSGASGGHGGSSTGAAGASGGSGFFPGSGGQGGTQAAGGAAGSPNASAGSLGNGGAAGSGGSDNGGGGGGGYYGGGGGGNGGFDGDDNPSAGGGGGGGSNYTGGLTNATSTQGARTGNGQITITYTDVAVDNIVKLVRAGSVVGNNMADTTTHWPSADAVKAYGGSSELWGTTLTPAQVNAADFGVVLSATVTSGIASVDEVTIRVYYQVAGATDPGTYIGVIELDTAHTTATTRIIKLARSGLDPANDPNIDHTASDVEFKTPRYYAPERSVSKVYRAMTLWADIAPATGSAGLQVWASVDDGAEFQMLDGDGNAATLDTTGAARLFFPKTAAAVGHWVQFRFTVPALSGALVAADVTVRNVKVYGVYNPVMTQQVTMALILRQGAHSDGQREIRTPDAQAADLEDLAKPQSAATPYKDPETGERGYLDVEGPRITELRFKSAQQTLRTAVVRAKVLSYE